MSYYCKYTKGSIWRKWDIHIHAPICSLNNQFIGENEEDKWDKYINVLNSMNDIAVFGITDYFSIDGYKIVKRYKDEGKLQNIDLILPNVELRILPVTREQVAINLHILFSPNIVDDLESKLFSNLKFEYSGQRYNCIKRDLINLGRKYLDNSSLKENSAYKEGIRQFKINFSVLKDILNSYLKLKENTLVVVSNSNHDGASGIQHSSLAATREEIYRFADFIFSSNPNDREYFLGKGCDTVNEIKRKYGELKPCIHGSDAHSLDKIGKPDLDRFSDHDLFCSLKVTAQLKRVFTEHCVIRQVEESPAEVVEVLETELIVSQSSSTPAHQSDTQTMQATEPVVEPNSEALVKEVKELPAGTLQNPSDEDVTCGYKGPGYEVTTTETCSPENPFQVITDVQVDPSDHSDQHKTLDVVDRLSAKQMKPEQLYTDGGFTSGENIADCADQGVDLQGNVVGVDREPNKLKLADFDFADD